MVDSGPKSNLVVFEDNSSDGGAAELLCVLSEPELVTVLLVVEDPNSAVVVRR